MSLTPISSLSSPVKVITRKLDDNKGKSGC